MAYKFNPLTGNFDLVGIAPDHASLINLDWSLSGHTGDANTFAKFDASGYAIEFDLLNTANTWSEEQTFTKGINIGTDVGVASAMLKIEATALHSEILHIYAEDGDSVITSSGTPSGHDWNFKMGDIDLSDTGLQFVLDLDDGSVRYGDIYSVSTGALFDFDVGASTVTTNCRTIISKVPTGVTHTTSSLVVNPASATANADLLWLGVGDSAKFQVDEDGNVFANEGTAGIWQVGDADDTTSPSKYLSVGASQDGKFYSLAVGTVYLDSTTSNADFYLRANDGGVMKNFLVIDASESLITIGQAGNIVLGDSTERDMYPQTDIKINLGQSGKRFNNGYLERIYFGASQESDITWDSGNSWLEVDSDLNILGDVTSNGVAVGSVTDYLSTTSIDTSTASSAEYNIFDQNNYPSATLNTTDNVTQTNIALTKVDGKFTVDNAGLYRIDCTYIIGTSSSARTDCVIKKNGTPVYDHDFLIHSSVDPAPFALSILLSLADDDYLTFHVECLTSATTTIQPGTTVTITRIG